MKTKGTFAFLLLALFISGAGRVGGADLHASPYSHTQFQFTNEPANCAVPGLLTTQYEFEVLDDASSVSLENGVVRSVLCNYRIATTSAHPAGSGHISGMAITIEYACPTQTTDAFKGKTGPRDNEIARTPNSVITRESGEFTSFSGDRTVQERMFALLDTHTIATIVIYTDPDPTNPNASIFSTTTGGSIAANLANTYGARANDPVCGPPPGANISTPGGSTSPPGTAIPLGTPPWDVITGLTAVTVAVGAGAIAALAGGLLGGTGGSALGSSVPAGAAPGTRPGPLPIPAATPATPAFWTAPTAPVSSPSSSPPPANIGAPQPVPEHLDAAPAVPPAPPVGPQPAEPAVASAVVEPPLVQSVIAAPEAIVAAGTAVAQASSRASTAESEQGEESDDQELERRCPEVQAPMFGLPAINSRQDCSGVRPSMDPWYAGIDFTSHDERGNPANLDFEACVTGEVSYVGGPFNMIEVKRESGNRIQFLHASEVYVTTGQQVGASTKLGKTGGTGPEGPGQYEIHLHVQAIDEHGNMIDPDCAIAGMDNRRLRIREKRPKRIEEPDERAEI